MTVSVSYVTEFGSGDISWAMRLAVDPTNGDVLVGDDSAGSVLRYDSGGVLLDTYAIATGVEGISGISVSASGKIWVTNFFTDNTAPSLYRLSADGTYEAGYYAGPFAATTAILEPNYVHVGTDGKIYVASTFYSCFSSPPILRAVGVRLAADASYERDFGEFIDCTAAYPLTPPDGKFVVPASIAVDSLGSVYVADLYSAGPYPTVPRYKVIHKFNDAGTFQVKFGGVGTGDGQFGASGLTTWYGDGMGMAIDADDNIYVADTYGGKVNIYDTSGSFQSAFGIDEAMSYPGDVACGTDGRVYVVDGDRVLVYQLNGGGAGLHVRGVTVEMCGEVPC